MGFFNRRKAEADRIRKAEAARQAAEKAQARHVATRYARVVREAERVSEQARQAAPRQSPIPDPTRPQSSLMVPQHLRDRALVAYQRAQHDNASEQFEQDLRRIYPPSKSNRSLPTLVRMFQEDWNADTLPLKGIRPVVDLPNLRPDGIPDARTQAAISAYRRLTAPDNLDTTAAAILDGFQHDVDLIPAEEPLRPPEEIVDDLQDLLGELDDDPAT